MGKHAGIQWTHHTFNPWRGCAGVSPGCVNCYAEAGSKRNPKVLGTWGANGTRVVAAESGWREPIKWDKAAKAAGERRRVFCASWADVFENWRGPMLDTRDEPLYQVDLDRWPGSGGAWEPAPTIKIGRDRRPWPLTMDDVRERLFGLIAETPNLDWLLLTKRPENFEAMLPWTSEHAGMYRERFWNNVWLGVSVENQEQADARIPHLLKIPAAVRFLSVEPMLGPVDLSQWLWNENFGFCNACGRTDRLIDGWDCRHCGDPRTRAGRSGLHLVIFGGESGPGARPCDVQWIRDGVRQCREAGVAPFVKQPGESPYRISEVEAMGYDDQGHPCPELTLDRDLLPLRDRHGADPAEWPEDLRVREFPEAKS